MNKMDAKKNCFVISPIGAEQSETRKSADDFLELLIEPALEPFGFNIIRADKISSPSIITSDIIKFVQSADLCIIDLTGSNPNVFYECGRRHENGRPFIQLIKKGEKLPFDVSNIRTISYDISNPRSTLETIRTIQSFVNKIIEDGYDAASKGDSLSSLSDSISRIERTVNSIASGLVFTKNPPQNEGNLSSDILTKHPIILFNESFEKGNLELAIKVLPRIKNLIGFKDWFLSACKIVETGETFTDSLIRESITDEQNIDEDLALQGFSSLYTYYYNRNNSAEGAANLLELYNVLIEKINISNKIKAWILNYISALYSQCNNYEQAIKIGEKILEYDVNGIYLMGLASSYISANRYEESVPYLDRYINQPDVNKEGLTTALKVFSDLKRTTETRKVEEMLQEA